MCRIEISCRDFKLAAGLNSVNFVAPNVGTDDVAVGNESINVICGSLGHFLPSREEMMMREGFRSRI